MELIRGLHNLAPRRSGNALKDCVLTIGNFDGVHNGHQMILQQLRRKAAKLGLPATLMVFEPQPMEFFAGSGAPARLTPFHEKVRLIQEYKIDSLVCLHFNEALRSMSAQTFIEDILVNSLSVKFLIVGDDFRFGCKQNGNFDLLRQAGKQHGFEVERTETFTWENERISSTRVRYAIEHSEFAHAEKMLSRPYSISGRVMYGRQLGRELGVPTANLSLKGKKVPLNGVFAVEVSGLEIDGAGPLAQGVANVGVRPTINGEKSLLEVHLFDFNENIYGKKIRVYFRHKIREEENFDSLCELKEQIGRDISAAKNHFGRK
jgi:riboflavin kinase/FMN adenylyltransferase